MVGAAAGKSLLYSRPLVGAMIAGGLLRNSSVPIRMTYSPR